MQSSYLDIHSNAIFFLLQAQSDVQSRVEHIEVLEQELFQCNQEIEQLKEERQVKAEETVRAQTVGGYFKDDRNFGPPFLTPSLLRSDST